MLYIGVDLGTSAVKLLLMRGNGEIVKIVTKEYPLFFPRPGWSEQNPEDWFTKTMEGLQELVKECNSSQIGGISFGGQMHGLVALDEKDEVIRPAILWNDGRTTEETSFLNEVIGKDKLSKYTANIAFAGFTAPKILWMKKHEPENFAKIRKIMLPKLYESYEVTGILRPEIADALGVNRQVKVIAGAGDNAAAAIGTGTIGNGMCNISLGTSGTIFISSDSFRIDKNNALHSFAHADGGYHLMGCMLSAASCNKWWSEEILRTKDFATEQAGIVRLGKNQVFYLPYLMGERSPHNNPDARAMFIGMSMDTTREDMTQAVLEGVIFGLRDSLEVARSLGLFIDGTRICGGGAKSPLWKKMAANILNMEVSELVTEEGPALGGAILAAVGCGEYDNIKAASETIIRTAGVIEPEQPLVDAYEEKYRKFREIYPAIKNFF